MTIDVSEQLASRLRDLALKQGQELDAVVEDALRRYLDDAAITDLEPADVAATQEKLAGELTDFPAWTDPAEGDDDGANCAQAGAAE